MCYMHFFQQLSVLQVLNITRTKCSKDHTNLKLGCGLMEGICPSMAPLSSMVRIPPGSNKAFSLSNTDGLKQFNKVPIVSPPVSDR